MGQINKQNIITDNQLAGLRSTIADLDTWLAAQGCFTQPAVATISPIDSESFLFSLEAFIHPWSKKIEGPIRTAHLNALLESPHARTALLIPLQKRLEAIIASIYYETYYETVYSAVFNEVTRREREKPNSKTCRFCKKQEPEVTFRSVAHALPECIGNKNIICSSECDNCNNFFGTTIENDFGNWSKPHRTIAHIKGKKKIPQMGRSDGSWNIKCVDGATHIKVTDEFKMYEHNEATNKINLTIHMDSFTPLAVYKTFCKMALSLAEEADLDHYTQVISWLLNPDHREKPDGYRAKLVQTFYPGSSPMEPGEVSLFRRRDEAADKPFLVLVVSFGLFCYQIAVPSGPGEQREEFTMPPFSSTLMSFVDLPERTTVTDFSSGYDLLFGQEKQLDTVDGSRTLVRI